MNEENIVTMIEKYLSGDLSVEEQLTFEEMLSKDTELQQQLELHRQADQLIRYAVLNERKKRLQAIDNEEMAQESGRAKRVSLVYRRLAIAASLLLVVAAGLFIWTKNNYSNAALASALYADTVEEVSRNGDDLTSLPYDEQLIQAQAFFKQGDYMRAEAIFARIANSDTDLAFQAEWNLVVTGLVQNGCVGECRSELNRIANDPSHPFTGRANKLQALLESPLYNLAN